MVEEVIWANGHGKEKEGKDDVARRVLYPYTWRVRKSHTTGFHYLPPGTNLSVHINMENDKLKKGIFVIRFII